MDAKASKVIRADFAKEIEALAISGFDCKGVTKEGLAFSDGNDTIVIKIVVKKEDFDLDSALEEKSEAVAKATEKVKPDSNRGRQTKKPTKTAMTKKDVDNVIDKLMGEIE